MPDNKFPGLYRATVTVNTQASSGANRWPTTQDPLVTLRVCPQQKFSYEEMLESCYDGLRSADGENIGAEVLLGNQIQSSAPKHR